jgi:hypothetical protein
LLFIPIFGRTPVIVEDEEDDEDEPGDIEEDEYGEIEEDIGRIIDGPFGG